MSRPLLCVFFFIFFASQLASQPLYSPTHIATIEITFEQSNWDTLLDAYHASGNGERLLATVEINGITFDSVGVRYRGSSTYHPANSKNPFNIKLDYLKNQDYDGIEVLKLSNGAKDPSFLREVLSLEAARQFMDAPRANYARVFVNGAYHGLYANVESINASFIERVLHLDPDAPRFECTPTYDFDNIPQNPPFGCTVGHGASLEYLGPGIACYFDHYQLQSNTGWEALIDATEALATNPSGAANYFDMDRMLWWSVFNNFFAHLDSYLGAGVRNYYLATTADGRFIPVPYDLNESFAKFPWVDAAAAAGAQPPIAFFQELDPFLGADDPHKPLLKALFGHPTWRRMYLAHYRTMVQTLVLSGWLESRAVELQDFIADELQLDPNSIYSFQDFQNNLSATVLDTYDGYQAYGLLPFINGRVAFLQSLPYWQLTAPELSNPAHAPQTPAPGQNVAFTVQLNEAANAWLGWRSNATESFKYYQLSDDGLHGDGEAGDLVYGVVLPVGAGGGHYFFYAENNDAGQFLPQKAAHEYYSLSTANDVVVNEIMASNETTVADQDGEYDDWIELYNNGSQTVDLSGWHLTDDPLLPAKWTFPNGVFLDPGAYLIVWADDDTDQAGLHASFKLSADGELVQLVNPNLQVVDEVVFPPLGTDLSYARCPNGIGTFTILAPSFASGNDAQCATATIEPEFEMLSFFPNPTGGRVHFATKNSLSGQVKVIDLTGRPLARFHLSGSATLDVSDWKSGLYLVFFNGRPVGKLLVHRTP